MTQSMAPFLTFNGQAAEAMAFYTEALPDAVVTMQVPYPSAEGESTSDLIMYGAMTVKGSELKFLDMDPAHPAPAFAWSTSLYVACDDEAEFDAMFAALSAEGSVMMGPESVGQIRKCAWVVDRYGVVWQPVWE
ncbi:MAG: VOC family protein [Cellulomonadaceae bacterium]|jgi:predicted 3-demethylubiquinone-9 3-methyltransferase (glyoxalase superfamily)|nr:VOC family protein [Cellulomonadaceae bacterium]